MANASLVQHLLDRIDLGALNPGDLIDEAELVATYGVSRTPVREALRRLAADLRVDLACAYRAVSKMGWHHSIIYNHISRHRIKCIDQGTPIL